MGPLLYYNFMNENYEKSFGRMYYEARKIIFEHYKCNATNTNFNCTPQELARLQWGSSNVTNNLYDFVNKDEKILKNATTMKDSFNLDESTKRVELFYYINQAKNNKLNYYYTTETVNLIFDPQRGISDS